MSGPGLNVAHDIAADHSAELLRAHAPVPATATHGRSRTWACVAKRHTWQAAQQAAVWAGLTYAEQLARKGRDVTITVGSATTLWDLEQQRCRRNSTHEPLRWRNIKKYEEINQRQEGKVTLSLDRLQRVWRTRDVHWSFKTKLCPGYPSGAQKACTSSVGLPSPHKQPKETCPRLIWPF